MTLNELNTLVVETILTATKKINVHTTNKSEKLTDETKLLLDKRRKLREAKKWDTIEYAELNKTIRKRIRVDVMKYYENLEKTIIEENKNMRILKTNLSLGKKEIIKLKKQDGTYATEQTETVKVAREFYAALYTSQLPERNRQIRKKIMNVGSEEVPDITITEIQNALHDMKNKKNLEKTA